VAENPDNTVHTDEALAIIDGALQRLVQEVRPQPIGRPSSIDPGRGTRSLTFRIGEAEFLRLENESMKSGVSIGQIVRDAIARHGVKR